MNNQLSEELDAARKKIDEVDASIVELLEKRMDLVSVISESKKEMGKAVHDAARENKVLEGIRIKVINKGYEDAIISVFQNIIQTSREFQQVKLEAASSENTRNIFGLIGEKLSHSLSPQIHVIIYDRCNIHGSYDLIETPRSKLPELIGRLKASGYAGFNVTVPYKNDIMKYLDSISQEALRVGAVNTVSLNKLSTGYNTDYQGFGLSLDEESFDPMGKRCAVLGSGGSAHAVVAYLEDHHASSIVIVTRDTDAALFKFPGLSCQSMGTFEAKGYDIVINTTPVGMFPNITGSPISKDQLEGVGFVMDLIYNPAETLLLKYAGELGINHTNGLYMLVSQAICAEEIWLGKKIDKTLITEIYEEIKKEV